MEHYGINIHTADRHQVNLLPQLGPRLNWVRVDANWRHIEPEPGRFNWDVVDETIGHAKAQGYHIYLTLAYTPDWANDGLGPYVPPIEVEHWKRFVRSIGTLYRDKVVMWGAWNEPNRGFFTGSLQQYVHGILRPMAEVLHEISPANSIAGPDLATQGSWPEWLEQFLRHGYPWINVLTVHNYARNGRKVLEEVGGQDTHWPFTPTVRQVMRSAGQGHLPLAITEFGWNTADVTEAEQADYYDQFFEAAQSADWLLGAIAFNLIDEPPSPHRLWDVRRLERPLERCR